MKIIADKSIPYLNDKRLADFDITTYENLADLKDKIADKEILLCRSTLKVDANLLTKTKIKCIATLSSGICHIDQTYLKNNKIKLLHAKGCNALSVTNYIFCTLAYLLKQGINLSDKTFGIIGHGMVGGLLKDLLIQSNREVVVYDPLISPPSHNFTDIEAVYAADIICVHANLHSNLPYPSYNLLDHKFFNRLKSNTIIINASRGSIVNEQDLLNTNKYIIYCTDVYQNEPDPNPQIIDLAYTCTPHIAGHSIEGKANAFNIICDKLHRYYLNKTAPTASTKSNKDAFLPMTAEQFLNIYNPKSDTMALKNATNIENTFQKHRKAHNFRHDVYGHLKFTENF